MKSKETRIREVDTPLGKVKVAPLIPLLELAWSEIEQVVELCHSGRRCVALTGGSTPKALYEWAAFQRKGPEGGWPDNLWWTTSDERYVSLESGESNQGNALSQLGEPLGISRDQWLLWETGDSPPEESVRQQEQRFSMLLGPYSVYDLCFLGMGDDGHTASLFPGSPLLPDGPKARFASVEVPGKGWRLTVTPRGLERCSKIIVMVTGANKAERFAEVMSGTEDVENLPIRLLARMSERVTWLVDPEAAAIWLGK